MRTTHLDHLKGRELLEGFGRTVQNQQVILHAGNYDLVCTVLKTAIPNGALTRLEINLISTGAPKKARRV